MIVTSTTKLIKESDMIDKHINEVHTIINNGDDIPDNIINELIQSIEGWRDCINEIELGINTNYQLNLKSKLNKNNYVQ
jgi:hypothetical protein